MIDEVKANRAINFIERICTHVKGDLAGKPLALEAWQREYIAQLFGTIGSDGLRQYRTSFVFLPRKNGKSNLIAAICLINHAETMALHVGAIIHLQHSVFAVKFF